MTDALVLAVPSKGRLMEQTAEVLARAGMVLKKVGSERGYRGVVEGLDGVEVIFVPASEIVEQLSEELEKRNMLVPADMIRENILETRADVPINAIHMHTGYKADLYPLREGDELRASAFQRRQKIDLGEPLGEVYLHSPEDLIIYKLIDTGKLCIFRFREVTGNSGLDIGSV